MQDFNSARRRVLQQGLSGLAAFLALQAMATPAGAFFPTSRQLPPNRSIYRVRGKVIVDGAQASKKTFVTPTSTLETGRRSHVVFRVGTDAHILRENSRIELASTDGLAVDGMRLLAGALLSVFGERPANRPYRLSTPLASLGIRGTGIYIESSADASYVCTCYGEVEVGVHDDPAQREVVRTAHHEAPRYILARSENGRRIVEAPMKNHKDAELVLIEAIVGREPPSGFRSSGSRGGY